MAERLLCTGAAPQRDALVPFGNIAGARSQARVEFHPGVAGRGAGTQNLVAKGDVGMGRWWLTLDEQVGISVRIYWLGSGVLG